MIFFDTGLRMAYSRIADLQRGARDEALRRAGYPDRERQPRRLRHWANR